MKTVCWNPEFGTGGKLHCECDLCGKAVDFKFKSSPNFKRAHENLKEKNWFARKIGDKWYDFCSDECFDQFREAD